MQKKPTDEMFEQLSKASSVTEYLSDNRSYLVDGSLAEYLNGLLAEKGLSKSEAIKAAEVNEIYGYQIFAGKRMPSRDRLLCLGIGMGLSLDEVQQLLKYAGLAPLYPKNKRDSIIIFEIQRCSGVVAVNNALYEQGETTLN